MNAALGRNSASRDDNSLIGTHSYKAARPYGFFKRLSVRAKLMAMIVVAVMSLSCLGILFLAAINEVKVSGPIYVAIAHEMDLRSDILPPPEFLVETHLTVLEIENALRSEPTQIDGLLNKLDTLKRDYDLRQSYWEQTLPSRTPMELQIRKGILKGSAEPANKYFQTLSDQFIPAIKRKNGEKASTIIDTQLSPLYLQHKDAIQHLADLTQRSQELRVRQAKQRIECIITLLSSVIVGSIVVTFAVGLYVSRSITHPLKKALEALQSVAQGDLTTILNVDTADEVGRMAEALNHALEKLCSTLGDASEDSMNASRASKRLATATEAIASGAQQQVASLKETSACLEEMTATVRKSADNARQASQLAASSRDDAEKGQEIVSNAVTAMADISASSGQIADIISMIDEIAFQTNLLAVNAAVEAARAGDQGRGFAVVASEVRNLAQRSSGAAKEIKGLI